MIFLAMVSVIKSFLSKYHYSVSLLSMLEKILLKIISQSPQDRKNFLLAKKQAASCFHLAPPANDALLLVYKKLLREKKIERQPRLENILKRRAVRTASGIACVTVMTKQYRCPGRCIFCPQVPGMPKSYLPDEPAMMRAVANKFDPYQQVQSRLRGLSSNGHPTDKIEIRIAGETWTAYPKRYQTWFVKRIFDALNEETSASLASAQRLNEAAKNRCIGMSIETRPDWITFDEVKRMRRLGVTLVELGVQHTDNHVLDMNQRDHTIETTKEATKMLRNAGFKIVYHMMPNLYGSTPNMDYESHQRIFEDANLRPDQLKIYPCILLKNTVLYRLYIKGKYRPYETEELKELLIRIKKIVPRYCRIIRVIRDVPGNNIIAGNKVTNLRQLIDSEPGFSCECIRCREPKDKEFDLNDVVLNRKRYEANGDTEHFISFESKDGKTLYGYVRLRLPKSRLLPVMPAGPGRSGDEKSICIPNLRDSALVRELHVYGMMVPLDSNGSPYVQHHGLGKRLMAEAEKIAKENGYHKLAVIAGIGVRPYYARLGYVLEGTYMIKLISSVGSSHRFPRQ
jgi:elongator complex protein 3